MTDNQLATLATLIWLVVTTVLFIELANWSAGGSWTIVPGLVRGVRGWVVRGQELDLPAFALSPRAASPGALVGAAPIARAALGGGPTGGAPAGRPRLPIRGFRPAGSARRDPDVVPLDPGAEIVELDHSEL